jgi:Mn-dependent DtxR family transcriptional regulator
MFHRKNEQAYDKIIEIIKTNGSASRYEFLEKTGLPKSTLDTMLQRLRYENKITYYNHTELRNAGFRRCKKTVRRYTLKNQ